MSETEFKPPSYPADFEAVLDLPIPQRLELVEDILVSIAADQDNSSIPEHVLALLQERCAKYDADPTSAISWEEAKRRLRK